jgi:hypothetical protein
MPLPMPDINLQRLIRLYRSNLPMRKLADIFGTSTGTVARFLADADEPKPPTPKTRLARIMRTQAEREWFEACRTKGGEAAIVGYETRDCRRPRVA